MKTSSFASISIVRSLAALAFAGVATLAVACTSPAGTSDGNVSQEDSDIVSGRGCSKPCASANQICCELPGNNGFCEAECVEAGACPDVYCQLPPTSAANSGPVQDPPSSGASDPTTSNSSAGSPSDSTGTSAANVCGGKVCDATTSRCCPSGGEGPEKCEPFCWDGDVCPAVLCIKPPPSASSNP